MPGVLRKHQPERAPTQPVVVMDSRSHPPSISTWEGSLPAKSASSVPWTCRTLRAPGPFHQPPPHHQPDPSFHLCLEDGRSLLPGLPTSPLILSVLIRQQA